MTNFIIGTLMILFGLHLVFCLCVGKVLEPPDGSTKFAVQGKDFKLVWKFDDPVISGIIRQWFFKNASTSFTLGRIVDDDNVDAKTDKLEIKIIKPSTLVLKNVDLRYNGTYQFTLLPARGGIFTSRVIVFVAVKPTVAIDCSSRNIVDEGDNVSYVCEGKGGNPPANVTWYKNEVQIGVGGDEEKVLTLNDINKKNSGTYKCVAQSHYLKDEASVDVFVNYPPDELKFDTPQNGTVKFGKSVSMSCSANAFPKPRYIIIHNGTEVHSSNQTHISFTVDYAEYKHAGSYKCIAKNKLGNFSKDFNLVVVGPTTVPPTPPTSHNDEIAPYFSVWRIIVSLLSGIIIGALLLYIVVCWRRRPRNRKPKLNPHRETPEANSTYQDLDLSKMKSQDNYETLRMNSGLTNADYDNQNVNQNDSTYTELNEVRDMEDNYQSLT